MRTYLIVILLILFFLFFFLIIRLPPTSTLFPYTTLFQSRIAFARFPRRPASRGPRTGDPGACRRERLRPNPRSEEHTSELQSLRHLVCRLLLEKKKRIRYPVVFHVNNLRISIKRMPRPGS